MSAATTAPAPTAEPSRSGRLLGLVGKLIDYGRELAATLRQRSATTEFAVTARLFGTSDIALILARITRGLIRADALAAKLVRNAARLDAAPRPQPARTVAKPASAARRQAAPPADPRLAHLPTSEQIAAEVRRRPIGAVIADICRDLGITSRHPLWRELQWSSSGTAAASPAWSGTSSASVSASCPGRRVRGIVPSVSCLHRPALSGLPAASRRDARGLPGAGPAVQARPFPVERAWRAMPRGPRLISEAGPDSCQVFGSKCCPRTVAPGIGHPCAVPVSG
jgi:hypothetical protein